jgi:hypothetical protein
MNKQRKISIKNEVETVWLENQKLELTEQRHTRAYFDKAAELEQKRDPRSYIR